MDVETKITVHRFSGGGASRHPVRISIIRGKSNRTIFLADDAVEPLRQILQSALQDGTQQFKGELKGT